MKPSIAVEVGDEAWTDALPDAETVVERAARAALTHLSSSAAEPMEMTVLLASDETVRALNARFRGQDKPTNVLSFPAPAFARPHLGDLALAYGTCAREAGEQAKSLADHLSHLTVHGVLHLLGYDHEADAEAESMEAMERSILKALGVRDPYGPAPDA